VGEGGIDAFEAEAGEGGFEEVEAGQDDVVAEGGEEDAADFEFFAGGDIGLVFDHARGGGGETADGFGAG